MNDKFEVAALALGTVSVVFGAISFFVFWWFSIIGLVCGLIGVIMMWSYDKGRASFLLPLTGSILSLVSLVLSLILLF